MVSEGATKALSEGMQLCAGATEKSFDDQGNAIPPRSDAFALGRVATFNGLSAGRDACPADIVGADLVLWHSGLGSLVRLAAFGVAAGSGSAGLLSSMAAALRPRPGESGEGFIWR